MKKVLLAVFSVISLNTFAQATAGDDNGFGIRLGVGIPADHYGMPTATKDIEGPTGFPENKISFGACFDNRWYVWDNGTFGAAINARWLDVDVARKTETVTVLDKEAEAKSTAVDIAFTSPGAIFTWYAADNFAVDVQWNISPEILISSFYNDAMDYDKAYGSLGWANIVGASARYKVFQAGVEYKISKPTQIFGDDDIFTMLEDETSVGNKLRIFIGFKF